MITLYDQLTAYCSSNNIPIPPRQERNILGHFVKKEFNVWDGPRQIEKVQSKETLYVNGYPDDFSKNMNHVIFNFFQKKDSLVNGFLESRPIPFKKFNFNIKPDLCEIFESVLSRKEITFTVNYRKAHSVQYIISYTDPAQLMFLGMSFEADLKKNNLWFLEDKKKIEPEKKARKRIPTKNPVFSLKKPQP